MKPFQTGDSVLMKPLELAMEFSPISPLSFLNGRENLLIVVAEQIQKEPQVEYGRIFDFLGARY